MTERWHTLANAILRGETASVAYARIYGVKAETARPNCSRLMQKPDFIALLESLREARLMDEDAVRGEIVAGHLSDMRNESLPVSDRRAARIALSKIYGLELNKTQVKIDKDPTEEIILEQLRLAEKAMIDGEEERRARGRRIKPQNDV